jgi:hypothetical protein
MQEYCSTTYWEAGKRKRKRLDKKEKDAKPSVKVNGILW